MNKTARFKALHKLPCCQCGAVPTQVAHSNFAVHGKCRGKKADDKYTIPLCQDCHQKLDQYRLGMDREQSLEWFEQKLKYVNEVLHGKDESVF